MLCQVSNNIYPIDTQRSDHRLLKPATPDIESPDPLQADMMTLMNKFQQQKGCEDQYE